MKRPFIALAAILLILISSSASAGQEYEIRLTQPARVGRTVLLSAVSNESFKQKLTFDNQVLHNSEKGFTLEFSALVTTLEVNAKNWVTRKSIKIVDSKLIKDGKAGPLLPKGSIVIASIQNGEAVFDVNGRRADAETTKGLRSVVNLQTSDGPTDDEIFGTPLRKRVGETWDVNPQAAIRTLREMGVAVKSEDIKGTSTLERVVNDYLFVTSWMSIGNVLLFPMPEGFKAENGEVRTQFSRRFPTKQPETSFDQALKIIISTNGRMQGGAGEPQTRVEISLESGARWEIRPPNRPTRWRRPK